MNAPSQIIALILGGLFAIAGIVLFAKKGNRGKNTIKLLGTEFQLAGSSLVIFVLGCLLIFAALRINISTGERNEVSPQPTNETSISTATPQPPNFVARMVFPTNYFERIEYDFESGIFAGGKIDDYLRLTRLAYGVADQTNKIFQVTVTIKNPSAQPMTLTVNHDFFSMEDDQGRRADLIYFCCAADGDLLPAEQERTLQLFFQAKGWEGKHVAANWIFFRINGFRPVTRATWKFRPLVAGER